MTAYTLGTRTFRTGTLLKPSTGTKTTIEYNGKFYADVPAGEDAQALVDHLNEQEAKAIAYRAQFATDEEWMRHQDEAAGG